MQQKQLRILRKCCQRASDSLTSQPVGSQTKYKYVDESKKKHLQAKFAMKIELFCTFCNPEDALVQCKLVSCTWGWAMCWAWLLLMLFVLWIEVVVLVLCVDVRLWALRRCMPSDVISIRPILPRRSAEPCKTINFLLSSAKILSNVKNFNFVSFYNIWQLFFLNMTHNPINK